MRSYGWPINDNVVANLLDGRAIEGVLLKRTGEFIVLANAVLHEPGSEPKAMDGQVYIERGHVAFLQRPKGG